MKQIEKFYRLILLVMLVLVLAGCSEPEDRRGRLEITGPAGMTVSAANQSLGEAPMKLQLAPREYLFKFAAPGYEPKWETIAIAPKSARTLAVKLQPVTGAVLVETRPAGAELVMDGKTMGATPLVLDQVPLGEHSGILRMPGYTEREIQWKVDDARPRRVLLDLDANVGRLVVTSRPPRARLTIDGRVIGVTPHAVELKDGRYVVRLELPGYSLLEESVLVGRGEELRKEFELQPLPGGISITSIPIGAGVFVNDVKRGITPFIDRTLTPGDYEFRVEKEGYDSETRKVHIVAGGEEAIAVTLGRNTGSVELYIRPAGVTVSLDGKLLGETEADPSGANGVKAFVVENLAPGPHQLTVAHPRAVPLERTLAITVEKNKLTRLKPIDIWLANCEITYKNGAVETGALFSSNDKEIVFGPEPGVKVTIQRNRLSSIRMLDEKKSTLQP